MVACLAGASSGEVLNRVRMKDQINANRDDDDNGEQEGEQEEEEDRRRRGMPLLGSVQVC